MSKRLFGEMSREKEGNSISKDFKFYVKKLIIFGKYKRSLQDLVLIYTFFSAICLAFFSIIISCVLGLGVNFIIYNLIAIFFFKLLYILSNTVKDLKVLRIVFISSAIIFTGILWFLTEGSSGPSILLIAALLTLLVFISVGKEFVILLIVTVLSTVTFYLVEFYNPHWVLKYANYDQKMIDTISFFLVLFSLLVPILIYARNVMYKEHNDALELAEKSANTLATMSHEIRTPMNAIIGFSELLSDPNAKKEECTDYIKIINQNSRALMNLLNNIINLSKVDSGTVRVYYSKCKVNRFLKYISETLSTLLQTSEIEIKTEYLNSDETEIVVDENLLFQILINLGYNAIKFTSKGYISIKALISLSNIVFEIKDTGVGIPISEQDGIFEKYHQANNNINLASATGVGLGLSICKSLTHILKGNIWFKSIENQGTTFFVELPLSGE